jgi:uncharacterized protein YbjT (DUF2867 family)
MILVTGATGTVGTEMVKELLAAGVEVRALVRSLGRARPLLGPDVEIVEGDLEKPETIDPAMKGVEKAFLLTSSGPESVDLHANFIAAAKRAGNPYVVRLSALGSGPDSPFTFGRWHGQSERHLEESGLPYTHLRPHGFMQNFLFYAPTIASDGAIFAPMGDAKIGMVDSRDVSAVAAKVLTEDGHQGRTYDITGPESLSYAQAAETLDAALGKTVRYVDVTPEQAKDGMMSLGFPEWLADAALELHAFYRTGEGEIVTPVVAEVTGRPPRTFNEFARDHAQAFAIS